MTKCFSSLRRTFSIWCLISSLLDLWVWALLRLYYRRAYLCNTFRTCIHVCTYWCQSIVHAWMYVLIPNITYIRAWPHPSLFCTCVHACMYWCQNNMHVCMHEVKNTLRANVLATWPAQSIWQKSCKSHYKVKNVHRARASGHIMLGASIH